MPTDSSGSWLVTFTGRKFYPLDPDPDAIDPMDLAVSLSRTCRWRGFARDFYSVAQHSVLVSDYLKAGSLSRPLRRWGLMHDAAEAYLGDFPRPLKQVMPQYKEAEDRIIQAVAERFGLEWPIPKAVQWADDVLLVTEADQLMQHHPDAWHKAYPYKPDPAVLISPLNEDAAYELWMNEYLDLFVH